MWYSGGDRGLDRIKHMIDDNPKKHMYEVNNPKHLLNCPNSLGLTPLYVACLNGHLEVSFYSIY